jgi:siroheme synthase
VHAAHTARQRGARCTLGTLAATVAEQALASPVVLVVGAVAGLGEGVVLEEVPPARAPEASAAHDPASWSTVEFAVAKGG